MIILVFFSGNFLFTLKLNSEDKKWYEGGMAASTIFKKHHQKFGGRREEEPEFKLKDIKKHGSRINIPVIVDIWKN